MFKHSQGIHAPVCRSNRLVLATGLLFGSLMVGSAAPARADASDCGLAFEHLARWTTDEASRGLSAEMLEDLRALEQLFTECAGTGLAVRPEPGPGGGEADPYLGSRTDIETWRPLAALYFDADDVGRAMCLMIAESGGNPEARNPTSGAAGLMQIMPFWAEVFGYSHDDLFRPDVNLWVASQIFEKQGWTAWTPYQRGLCS